MRAAIKNPKDAVYDSYDKTQRLERLLAAVCELLSQKTDGEPPDEPDIAAAELVAIQAHDLVRDINVRCGDVLREWAKANGSSYVETTTVVIPRKAVR